MANQQEPVSLDALSSFGYSDAHAWPYQQVIGKELASLSDAEILRRREEIHQYYVDRQPQHAFIKTHNIDGKVGGLPMFSHRNTLGVIYIVRNPWDVALSYGDHFGITIDDAIESIAQPTLMTEPSARNVRQYLGSWSGHVASWHRPRPIKRLTILYEDMQKSPVKTFNKVARFLGMPDDPIRLQRAVEFSSFAELSAQESKSGFVEKSSSADRFFRSGRAGGWRDALSNTQIAQIEADHKDVLTKLGYLDKAGKINVRNV